MNHLLMSESNEDIVEHHKIIDDFEQEKIIEQRFFALTNRTVNTIILVFAVEQSKTLQYDTMYNYNLLLFFGIVAISFYTETRINRSLVKNKYGITYVLLFIKAILGFVNTYFIFQIVQLIHNRITAQTDDEPWSYEKIIRSSILLLFLIAGSLIIDLQLFQPVEIAKRLENQYKQRAKQSQEQLEENLTALALIGTSITEEDKNVIVVPKEGKITITIDNTGNNFATKVYVQK